MTPEEEKIEKWSKECSKDLLWRQNEDRIKKKELVLEEPPAPITWEDFDKIEFPKDRWLIQHLIPKEGFAIIASPSGEKKTWVAMEMARCIAGGENFLDHPDFRTVSGNVLYIDQEMPKTEIQRRGRLLGLNKTKKIFLLSRNEFNISKEENVNWLYLFVTENDIKAIFVDTLRAVAGGLKENEADEVRAFFNLFKPLKDKGVVIIFLDHCRKPAHFEGKIPKKEQLFASQDKVASVEVLLMIKSDERNEEILVYQKKSRSGIEYAPFKIQMKDEMDDSVQTIAIKLSYEGKIEEKEYIIDQAKGFVLDVLSNDGKKRQEIIAILKKEKKIGEKNISEAIRELQKENKIKMQKHGQENYYEINKEQEEEIYEPQQDKLL